MSVVLIVVIAIQVVIVVIEVAIVSVVAVALIWSSRPEIGVVTNIVDTASICVASRQSRKTINNLKHGL